jgi:hypothetical protein
LQIIEGTKANYKFTFKIAPKTQETITDSSLDEVLNPQSEKAAHSQQYVY